MISQIVLISLLSDSSLAMPSSPPPPCICSDGTGIFPGQTHKVTDCDICKCNEQDSVSTDHINCSLPGCVEPYSVEGDGVCCPSCPKGPDCEANNGPGEFDRGIIPADHNIHFLRDYACSCNGPSPANASCFPYPGPKCLCHDGLYTVPGHTHYISDCDMCTCSSQYHASQYIIGCFEKECVDPLYIAGDGICCPICPNGRNCYVKPPSWENQTLISFNTTVVLDSYTCKCVVTEPYGYVEGMCIPPLPTSPTAT